MTETISTLGSSHSNIARVLAANKGPITASAALVIFLIVAAITGTWSWYAPQLLVFFLLLSALLLMVRYQPVDLAVASRLNSFAAFLKRRGAFTSSPEKEAPKFALIRILFGLFMLERAFWILSYLEPSDWSQPVIWITSLSALLGAVLVILGLFTQCALVILIVFQWRIGDTLLSTQTLGNYIASMLAVLLLFANAGANFSLDRILIKRGSFLAKVISPYYYRNGLPTEAGLQVAKFMTLACYWCVCVYSLFMHLGEPAWMTGVAGPQLLTNNFMSRFSDEFAWFFSLGTFPVFLGKISLWAMLPWYLFLLPFVVIGGWFRRYAIIWSVLFFSLSLFVLHLGWLGQFEFLFFAGLFWEKSFICGPKTLQVAYDDRCNLCDRTVNIVKAVDIFRRVELRPLSKNAAWLQQYGIDPADAQKDLYAVDTGDGNEAAKGYEFYLLLSRHVLLLLPFYPLLFVGKYIGGRAIYRFIADRRTQLFGVCQIPTPKPDHVLLSSGETVPSAIQRGDPISPSFIHVMFLAACYLVTIPVPHLWLDTPKVVEGIQDVAAGPALAATIYGVGQINVFNQTDLRMAETWFTIAAKQGDGSEELLPIFSEDGKRLAAHRSDRVYFGNTLAFRRAVIGQTGCQFESFRRMLDYLVENSRTAAGKFVYRQYFEPLPSAELISQGRYVVSPRQLVCETIF